MEMRFKEEMKQRLEECEIERETAIKRVKEKLHVENDMVLSLSLSHSLSLSLTHTLIHTHKHSLSLPHTHTQTLSL